jgi:hypothetical protein
MKNEKTINLDAFHVEFTRQDKERVTATVIGETPGGKRVRVKIQFKFYCLPWALRKLSAEWKIVRESRLGEIGSIDKVLP